MPDSHLIELLYARQTLEECTAPLRNQTDLPPASDLGRLMQAQTLLEQGKTAEARDMLRDVMERAEESRVALWAGKALRDLGFPPTGPLAKQALGVVIEMPMDDSKDVLAVYRDNRVRFFSYAGGMSFYEPSANVQGIHSLCQQMIHAADRIQPIEGASIPQQDEDAPQITILTVAGEVPVSDKDSDSFIELGAYLIEALINLQQEPGV